MVDKVKPLGLEDSTSGTQLLPTPTEMNPLQDYVAAKGIAFENLNEFLHEKIGRVLTEKFPDLYQQVTYLGNGEVNYIEYFNSNTFITSNRIARVTVSYDLNINPTGETLVIFSTDGTTILRTVSYTHTFSGYNYTSTYTNIV